MKSSFKLQMFWLFLCKANTFSHVHISLIKGAEGGEASSDASMKNQVMEEKTMDS